MKIPHGIPAKKFIDWVNFSTQDEAKRCRILLAELLLRTEKKTHRFTEKELIEIEDRLMAIATAEATGYIIRPDGSQIISSMASQGDVAFHLATKASLENKLSLGRNQ